MSYAGRTGKKIIGIKKKRKINYMLKLTLHDDRVIAVNLNKVIHVTVTQDDETGAEYSRILMEEGQTVDVTESLDTIVEKVNAST